MHWLHVNVQLRNGTPLECEEVSDMRDQKLDGGGESFLTPAAGKRWQFPTSSQGGESQVDLRKFRSEEPSVRHRLEKKYPLLSCIPSVIMWCKCSFAVQGTTFLSTLFEFQWLCYNECRSEIVKVSGIDFTYTSTRVQFISWNRIMQARWFEHNWNQCSTQKVETVLYLREGL